MRNSSRHWIVNQDFVQLSAFSGIIAPAIYVISLLSAGLLRPGYNHMTQYVSYLGAGSDISSFIMNYFGFLMFGILTIIFGIGLSKRIEGNRILKFSFEMIILVFGFSTALFAFFPIDSSSILHDILGKVAGIVYIAPWFAAMLFMRDRNWNAYWLFSISITSAIAMIGIYYVSISTEYVGLFQRAVFGLILIWIEVISVRLLILSNLTWKHIS